MRACDDGAPNQKWYFDEQAKRLKTKFDDKCLDYNYNYMYWVPRWKESEVVL